jgi:mono/diheme cytochrome c family protein
MKPRQPRWAALMILGLATAPGNPAPAGSPTYHGEVERILQRQCQECHRPGQVAPFSLLNFDQARKRASDLAAVTHDRRMPPWPVSTREGGPFKEARILSEAEIATLAAWAEACSPEGDPRDAPPPRQFASGWPMGEPDLILSLPEPYALDAEGDDEHRVFVLPTALSEGKWIAGIDYKPGNPKVVHHALGALDVRKRARVLDGADPRPGYRVFGGFGLNPDGFMSGWSPGRGPTAMPPGVGRYMPAGADFLLQVHYHKSGKPETDATQVGLYFARDPVDKEISIRLVTPPMNRLLRVVPDLMIPAGADHHEVAGSLILDGEDRHLIGVTPHMHWLGKDFLLRATLPDGSKRMLIKVDRWDFNWQGSYDFTEPIALPRGTKVEMVAHFDNSEANRANPSRPPVFVHWGERTTDEMCLGFLHLTRDAQHLENLPPPRFRTADATRR